MHVSGVWDIYVLALEGVCYDAIAAACMRPAEPPSGSDRTRAERDGWREGWR